MTYKSFRLHIIARVLMLSATLFLLFYLITQTDIYVTASVVALLVIYQVYVLIHYVDQTNRRLSQFLQSIRYTDFSQSFSSEGHGASFDELNAAFTEVVDEFRKARAEKEEHFQYLQTVVQHIGVGLIAFTPDGEVKLINTAAKRLLDINQLVNIRFLEPLGKTLVDTILSMKSGGKTLVKVNLHKELSQLVIYATELRLRGQHHTLVSIQNIQTELDEKEMEAWQKLVRVLTHEIMNSLTPISSLASTVNEMLKLSTASEEQRKPLTTEALQDVRGAVQTIEKRSQGLLHFVDAYRTLTRIPPAQFQIVSVIDLFGRVEQLLQQRLADGCIRFIKHVEPQSLELTADPELIEQVLINLVLNAIEALAGRVDATISLLAHMGERGRVTLEVTDNGPGISKEVQDRIFVPFFTTKPRGSGIGLSLSRQIMRIHQGTIHVNSEPDQSTVFSLQF